MKDWYIFIGEEECCYYGKIVNVYDEFILVKLMSSSGDIPQTSRLFHLTCLAHSDEIFFFENEQQLKDWLIWLDTPENNVKLKVVNFKKDK